MQFGRMLQNKKELFLFLTLLFAVMLGVSIFPYKNGNMPSRRMLQLFEETKEKTEEMTEKKTEEKQIENNNADESITVMASGGRGIPMAPFTIEDGNMQICLDSIRRARRFVKRLIGYLSMLAAGGGIWISCMLWRQELRANLLKDGFYRRWVKILYDLDGKVRIAGGHYFAAVCI